MQATPSDFDFFMEKILPYTLRILLLVIPLVIFIASRVRKMPSSDWPSVEGSVQYVKVYIEKGKHVAVNYSYFVNEYQSGEYIQEFLRESAAYEFADGLKDKKVRVHYNPRNPAISNLKKEELEKLLPPKQENRIA